MKQKEQKLKNIAKEYKSQLTDEGYNALYNYKIEITH